MTSRNVTAGRENGRSRPKGYASWRPQARTRLLLEQVEHVLDEYAQYLPLTVRQIFYRLVGSFGFEKSEQAYVRLAEHLVRARRARLVPFEAIRDDGVVMYHERWYEGVEEFWNDTGSRIHGYRRDRQAGQPVRLELWCEAAGMAPQLARVADDYSVPVYSAGGFASLSAVRYIADRARNRTVPTVLLHVGDFDPSGESIFEAMTSDAAAFLEQDRLLALQRIEPVRVALTEEQVRTWRLRTAPAKALDGRSRSWRGGTCQLEALAPDHLAAIVRAAIVARLVPEKLKAQLRAEEEDVAELWRGLPAAGETGR